MESREDAAAYAATRMPATYAAVRAALAEAAKGLPGFSPRTLLDAGAGPGTASWAAFSVWPVLGGITLLEREPSMIELGKRLMRGAREPLSSSEWKQADLAGKWESNKRDIVVISYALGELAENQREKLLQRLWACAGSLLVIVEPGTPRGFEAIRQARDSLISAGAAVAAPCPHGGPCPMQDGNWCHFSARLARSRLHRQAKGAELAYEDEKFSYVAFAKDSAAKPCEARVLRHPLILKGHVKLELCTKDGLKSVTVAKSQGESYKLARGLKWGDAMGFVP